MRKNSTPPKTPSNVIQFNPFDPDQVNQRLYKQVSALLSQLEEKDSRSKVTMRERIAALIAVGRLQDLFAKMRKATGDVGAGTTVRKYQATFATDATGRGAKNTRSGQSEPEPDNWFDKYDEDDGLGGDNDDAA